MSLKLLHRFPFNMNQLLNAKLELEERNPFFEIVTLFYEYFSN